MSDVYLGIDEIVGFQVQSVADWRRRKAEQFPGDRRNFAAAAALDRLAAAITKLEGSELHRHIDALINLTHDADVYIKLNQAVSAALREFGLHVGAESGAAFLEWYYSELRKLPRYPVLAEQVEDSEAVRTAKRAHKEAYQRAFAGQRKLS
jgi:hypothetical protein